MTLTIGSLFSGIGGLDLGLERAGLGPVLWQVERDPFCREVLTAHWPDARRYDDVCSVGATTLAPVDVICGGFPCQDVSLAGKGAGLLAGERTGLWREFARIVREMRPRFVVAENVPGLIRRGLDVVVTDLAAAGYAVETTRLAAADLGAPHRRERLFLVAHRDSAGLRDQSGGGSRASRSGSPESDDHGEAVANAQSERRGEGRAESAAEGQTRTVVTSLADVAHGHGHGREGERRCCVLDGERQAHGDDVDRCGGETVADAVRSGPGDPTHGRLRGGKEGTGSRHGEPERHGCSWPPPPDDLHAWGGGAGRRSTLGLSPG